MEIINEYSENFDFKPFLPRLKAWFSIKTENELPSFEEYIAQPDELETYRIEASIQSEPLKVVYDRVGEKLEKLYGSKMSGKNLEELYNDWLRKEAYLSYKKLMEQKMPLYEHRTFSTIIGKIGYYKLHLPCGAGEVSKVVTYLIPSSPFMKDKSDWEPIVSKTPWL